MTEQSTIVLDEKPSSPSFVLDPTRPSSTTQAEKPHKRIALAKGRGFALVDAEDFDRLNAFAWRLSPQGYAQADVPGKHRGAGVLMHRLVAGCERGDGMHAHHRNEDKLDNRRSNLVKVTPVEHKRLQREGAPA